jgi:hypothetical protein
MDDNVASLLTKFDVDELREELLSRGVAMHVRVASLLEETQKNLGGRAELAHVASKDICEALLAQQKVIYGVDTRHDMFAVTNQGALRNAESAVSLFRSSRVRDNGDGTSTLQTGVFGQMNSLCPEEPFFSQPAGAFCSGFLVGSRYYSHGRALRKRGQRHDDPFRTLSKESAPISYLTNPSRSAKSATSANGGVSGNSAPIHATRRGGLWHEPHPLRSQGKKGTSRPGV